MIICERDECCACYACVNICPKHCVTMSTDDCGEMHPVVDDQVCIDCGLCYKVCPVNSAPILSQPELCYAAWSKDQIVRDTCASGGVATALSQRMIKSGGVVYGATVQDGVNICHIKVTEEAELPRLKGSKYVQSSIGDSLANAKEDLIKGRQVLFIGTPCQISGLKSYLNKEYENLITVDLICHGTPPVSYLQEYIKKITGSKYKEVSNIIFRSESYFELKVYRGNEIIYSNQSEYDLYYQAFLQGLTFRNNCYQCKYAQIKRVSDLTIGDFWGLGADEPFDYDKYKVSVVLVNSEKGKQFLQKSNNIMLIERTVEEAFRGNDQLRNPFIEHRDRNKFITYYKKYGFVRAVKSTNVGHDVIVNKKNYYIGCVAKKLPKIVKRLLKKL